eukprot:scaffold103067_cov54-Phaeocystis_antarctica.AAC.1
MMPLINTLYKTWFRSRSIVTDFSASARFLKANTLDRLHTWTHGSTSRARTTSCMPRALRLLPPAPQPYTPPPAKTSSLARRPPCGEYYATELLDRLSLSHTHRPTPSVAGASGDQEGPARGQTIMVDANLQQPSGALRKDVSERSGLPADSFELYHGSKRLEGEAVLARWGVEKDSLIEVKTHGRGGMHSGGGGGGGADGGGGVGGGGGGTDSCPGG